MTSITTTPSRRTPRTGWRSRTVAALGICALAVPFVASPAQAAPGDTAFASTNYLAGSLLTADLNNVVQTGVEIASSDGTTTETNQGNLDLSVLGLQLLNLPGGIDIPLDNTDVGVIGQYAHANNEAYSMASTGALASDGAIATGGTSGTPGELSLSLSGVTENLGIPLSDVADVSIAFDGVSALAEQQAPNAATGEYNIEGAYITLDSPLIAGVASGLDAAVAGLDTQLQGVVTDLVNGINGLLGATGPIAAGDLDVTLPDFSAVTSQLTGEISDPVNCPGVSVNLGTGLVQVDLAEITSLNNLAPNTPILTATELGEIGNSIDCLLAMVVGELTTALDNALDTFSITADLSVAGGAAEIDVDIDLSGNETLVLTLLTLPVDVSPLLSGVGTLLDAVNANAAQAITDLGALNGIAAGLGDLLDELDAVVEVTVNNQSTDANGRFTESAVRVDVIAGTDIVDLYIANATVGANVLGGPEGLSLNPTAGPEAGGQQVTITGYNFLEADNVTIDGASVAFTIVDDTTITFVTPPHDDGVVPVVVESPHGVSDPLPYTYLPDGATALNINPNQGTELGGTPTVITGVDFNDATAVTFDGIDGTDFQVISDTEIHVTTPPHVPGLVDVIVKSPHGDSNKLGFRYVPEPAQALDITPDEGPDTGGTPTVITGLHLAEATGVTFDGIAGTSFNVVDDTTIEVTTPAGDVGPAVVIVQSPNGNSAPLSFTYIPDNPTITDIDPDRGPEAGGQTVTITGTGFQSGNGIDNVTFDGIAGTNVTVISNTELTVVTPPHDAGTVEVVVNHADTGASNPLGYTYLPDGATATGLTPDEGPEAGGTLVTITGDDFNEATGATFDGLYGAEFKVIDDNTIIVKTPPHESGTVDVYVMQPHGNGGPLQFTYLPDGATATSLIPDEGPETGGTVVTITGSDFTEATGVTFDGIAGTNFTVLSDTVVQITTPAHTPGPVDVVVQQPYGNSAPLTYTYTKVGSKAQISSLDPDNGPVEGGTTVTIDGSGFENSTGVEIDGDLVTDFTVINDSTIEIITPAHPRGPVAVQVIDPDGDSNTLTYTYTDSTVITSIDPDEGPTDGGTLVRIMGACFTGATDVTFDGVSSPQFVVISDSVIEAVTPAHPEAVVDVSVIGATGCGDGTLEDAFTYEDGDDVIEEETTTTAPPAPTTTGPAELPETGSAHTYQMLLLAGLMLSAGAGLMLARRRRGAF